MQETPVQFLDRADSPGGGRGNPLQCSCLENPMDRRAWRATVCRVTKSRTRLSDKAQHSTAQHKCFCKHISIPQSSYISTAINLVLPISCLSFSGLRSPGHPCYLEEAYRRCPRAWAFPSVLCGQSSASTRPCLVLRYNVSLHMSLSPESKLQ